MLAVFMLSSLPNPKRKPNFLFSWLVSWYRHKACTLMYKLGFTCAKFVQFRHLAAVVELIKHRTLKSYNTHFESVKTGGICGI